MPRAPKAPIVFVEGSIESRARDYIYDNVSWKLRSRIDKSMTPAKFAVLGLWDGRPETIHVRKSPVSVRTEKVVVYITDTEGTTHEIEF